MAGDNLTVTFGADASKLRSEIKFVSAEMKNLDKQINAAFKAGDTGRARELSNTFGALQTKTAGLNRELNGTAGALDRVTAAGRQTEAQFRRIGTSANSIGRLISSFGGGFAGGLVGAAVVGGLRAVTKELDEQIERIVKIRDLARDTARSPASVAAAQNVARAAGESVDDATKALQTQAANFAELQKRRIGVGAINQTPEAQAKRQELIQQRARLLGGGSFSDKDKAIDLSKIYEILTVDLARFKDTEEDAAKAANFIDTSFLKMVNSGKLGQSQLNEIAKALYGVNKASATNIATANIQKYNDELAATKNTTNTAVSDAEELAKAQGKLGVEFDKSIAPIVHGYTQIKAASAKAAEEILKGGVAGVLENEGKRQLQDAENQKDANILIWNTLGDAATAAGQKIKDAFQSFGAGGGAFGDPSTPAMPTTPIKDEFDKLPPFFRDITKTIGDVWDGLWKHLSISAQAAELSTAKSAEAMGYSFAAAANTAEAAIKRIQNAANAAQAAVSQVAGGAASAAGGGAGAGAGSGSDVMVFRGGIGDQGGHGPASFATQSITPGRSDYQAPPPKRIDLVYAGGGAVRGPGTGTSDSIMARLSNGEFVMRAAAVQHWGAGFMSNLNRFAGGGMVMPSRGVPSFASGGMVAAGGHHGGGAVVNLNFPGGSFSLRGDNETVGALTREARRAGMLQGGRLAGALQ